MSISQKQSKSHNARLWCLLPNQTSNCTKEWAYESTIYSKFTNKLLRVEIPKLINVIGILVTKRLLVVITYRFLPKDEANGIN
jgi:hypothetical protein